MLAIYRERALVAILQQASCLTVMTWNQFVPRLAEFGRTKLPRKVGAALAAAGRRAVSRNDGRQRRQVLAVGFQEAIDRDSEFMSTP